MKRGIILFAALSVCLLTAGCQNFWANYYAIQPGVTNRSMVKDLLGDKPFVESDDRLIYQAPKKNEDEFGQEVIIYLDENGTVLARRRKNPMLEPPIGEDGNIKKEEVAGSVPEFTGDQVIHRTTYK